MKKTAEEILEESAKNLGYSSAYNLFWTAHDDGIGEALVTTVLSCMQRYAAQSNQTPTEAEINEAAEKHSEAVFLSLRDRAYNMAEMQDCYERGFEDCAKWLQNYQTQGRDKTVEDQRPLIQQILDYLHKNITASMEYEFPHDYTCGEKWPVVDYFPQTVDELLNEMAVTLPASQHNAAIAVIEAQLNFLSIQRKTANAFDLHAIKHSLDILETILKQIKA